MESAKWKVKSAHSYVDNIVESADKTTRGGVPTTKKIGMESVTNYMDNIVKSADKVTRSGVPTTKEVGMESATSYVDNILKAVKGKVRLSFRQSFFDAGEKATRNLKSLYNTKNNYILVQ